MRYFLLTAIILIGVASCKKAEVPVSREDELRQGKWKKIAGTIKKDPAIGMDTLIHYYDSLKACQKDDYIVFGMNRYASQFPGQRCDFSEPDEIQFSWELYNNEEAISFWNANQTFFNQSAVNAPFLTYKPSEFTIRYIEYPRNATDTTKRDTITYTHTFAKF